MNGMNVDSGADAALAARVAALEAENASLRTENGRLRAMVDKTRNENCRWRLERLSQPETNRLLDEARQVLRELMPVFDAAADTLDKIDEATAAISPAGQGRRS